MYILMLIISIFPDTSIITKATQHGGEKVRKITCRPPPYFLCVSKTTFHLYVLLIYMGGKKRIVPFILSRPLHLC